MTPLEKEELRARFGFRCGYCGVSETDVGAILHHDHFRPTSRGGADDASNWIYCCFACNSFKGAYWPQSPNDLALLHPTRDDFSSHVREEKGLLIGLSPQGRFHIKLLHLNRVPLVLHRYKRAAESELDDRIRELEVQVEADAETISRLLEQINQI